MSRRSLPDCTNLSALVLLALLPRPAAAGWPSSPATNVPLGVVAGRQGYPQAAPDGHGGAIVAWDDGRGGPRDIYVQRVDATGPRWTVNGVAICSATGEQYEPELVADGSGGVIVTWSDFRGAAFDIYAQRVDSTGAPKWTANGVAICTATGSQSHPAIVSDGAGGALIFWDDARVGNNRIYGQRVNVSGAPQWTANGVALTNSLAGQTRPVAVSTGAGGAVVAWEDYRNGELDYFAQRILSNGTLDPAWPIGGKQVIALWVQEGLAMVADGSGGALLTWAQESYPRNINAQHLLASGALDPAWPANGRVMISDFIDQGSPAIAPDGAGGAIVSWDDQRATGRDIYAKHVLATGVLDAAWPDTGLAVCQADQIQSSPRMVPDGSGGAIVTWEDQRNDAGDLYVQHVLATGAVDPAWPADGRALSTAAERQLIPSIVGDGAGGAVVAWEDGRNHPEVSIDEDDVYAQGVNANGTLGDPPVGVSDNGRIALALGQPSPNPSRTGAILVRFTLPTDAAATLALFDVAGRRVAAREVGSLGPGTHALDLAADGRPAAGIYFIRLQQGPHTRSRRVVVLDR